MPPSACSNRRLGAMAPVKAPLSWPKSSLSSRPGGMAAQLSLTNGPSRGGWLVDRPGDELLAGAGLAWIRTVESGARRADHVVQEPLRGPGFLADDLLEPGIIGTRARGARHRQAGTAIPVTCPTRAWPRRSALQRRSHGIQQHLVVERLPQELHSAGPQRLHPHLVHRYAP